MATVFLTSAPLSLDEAYRAIAREDCGAVCVFLGTVRDHNEGKHVVEIDYTSFEEMAVRELRKIADEIERRWGLRNVWIGHRTGRLKPGDISVIVAVSAPHRAEAFEACRHGIEALKKTAPIWKEEFYEEGKAWVSG